MNRWIVYREIAQPKENIQSWGIAVAHENIYQKIIFF